MAVSVYIPSSFMVILLIISCLKSLVNMSLPSVILVMSLLLPLVSVKVHLISSSDTSGEALRIVNLMVTSLYTTPSSEELTACTVGGTIADKHKIVQYVYNYSTTVVTYLVQ